MIRLLPFIGVAVVLVVILIASSVFRIDERRQALVLQFGQVKQVVTEPGLGFKVPLIQEVVLYEDRILPLETSALEVTPADERRLVVDAFARWRITDVVQFRRSVQTEVNATLRLENILNAALREVLGSVQSSDVLSPERTVLMSRIRDAARKEAEALGVEVIDVRIRRADLPEQNLQATFNRMNAERQREAADERARGEERAQEIRATADRESVELVSDAQRQAEVIRGQADAERNNIYASAYGRDEEFFAFYRSLKAYERGLQGRNSTMVISPDGEFFDYLKSDLGAFSPDPMSPILTPRINPPESDGAGDAPGDESGASAGPPNMASTEQSDGAESEEGAEASADDESATTGEAAGEGTGTAGAASEAADDTATGDSAADVAPESDEADEEPAPEEEASEQPEDVTDPATDESATGETQN